MKKVVVIIGQTASGKSDLGMQIAQEYNGEILAADSRTIYTGMDIGTAKPSPEDRKKVKHYGLDLIDPSLSFSAAEFKAYAETAVADMQQRGVLPIIVGGSGLYIDSYIYDFSFTSQPNEQLRNEINSLDLLQLQQRAIGLGISENDVSFSNPRHLGRMIERVIAGDTLQDRSPKPSNVLLIGLQVPREQLVERIESRVDTMFNTGLVEEVRTLTAEYGSQAPGLLAPGYRAVAEYLAGTISLEASKELFIRYDKRLAKRQRTWFKRNPDIIWCSSPEEGIKNIRAFLA